MFHHRRYTFSRHEPVRPQKVLCLVNKSSFEKLNTVKIRIRAQLLSTALPQIRTQGKNQNLK